MLVLSAAKVQQYREREEWEEPAALDMLTSRLWSSQGRLLVKEKSPVGGECIRVQQDGKMDISLREGRVDLRENSIRFFLLGNC
jgi:hypothetical protein